MNRAARNLPYLPYLLPYLLPYCRRVRPMNLKRLPYLLYLLARVYTHARTHTRAYIHPIYSYRAYRADRAYP